jgi:hypothetical protein
MPGYRPPQRQIEAWVLAGTRWLKGTFHLPKLHTFDDHLRKPRPFYLLTAVTLGGDRILPFLAVRRSFVSIVVPTCIESDLQIDVPTGTRPRAVECWLNGAVVVGELAIPPNVRVSDFVVNHDGFLTLRNSVVTPTPPGLDEFVRVALVNVREVVATTEEKTMLDATEIVELESREVDAVVQPG